MLTIRSASVRTTITYKPRRCIWGHCPELKKLTCCRENDVILDDCTLQQPSSSPVTQHVGHSLIGDLLLLAAIKQPACASVPTRYPVLELWVQNGDVAFYHLIKLELPRWLSLIVFINIWGSNIGHMPRLTVVVRRQRARKIHEWIECDGNIPTRAHHFWTKLTLCYYYWWAPKATRMAITLLFMNTTWKRSTTIDWFRDL